MASRPLTEIEKRASRYRQATDNRQRPLSSAEARELAELSLIPIFERTAAQARRVCQLMARLSGQANPPRPARPPCPRDTPERERHARILQEFRQAETRIRQELETL